jgi:hypothetical protein
MDNYNILVATNLPEDVGLELCKVGFTMLGVEVPCNGSFKISKMLSNFVLGLIGLPLASDL